MRDHISTLTWHCHTADTVPGLLSAALSALGALEEATAVLVEAAPAAARTSYQCASDEAAGAHGALASAPLLAWPTAADLLPHDRHREFASASAGLASSTMAALLRAAGKGIDQDDLIACMQAAEQAGYVHALLR